jgi:hypothetical protein
MACGNKRKTRWFIAGCQEQLEFVVFKCPLFMVFLLPLDSSGVISSDRFQQVASESWLNINGEETMAGGSMTPLHERPRSPSPVPQRSCHSGRGVIID